MNGFISVLLFTPNDLTEARRTRPERVSSRLISNLPQFFLKPVEGISYFPYTVALSARDKVRPPHLTRETFSGRKPVDGADTLGGVFRPGEPSLGAEGKIKAADAVEIHR